MIEWRELEEMTLTFRQRIAAAVLDQADRADFIPPGWNNNLRWHVGHLAYVPRALTRGLSGEPIGIPEERYALFKKGSGPHDWDSAPVPTLQELVDDMLGVVPELFGEFEDRRNLRYATAYRTSAGVELGSPAESLTFSLAHDGIHLGLIIALRRAIAQG